MLNLPKIKNLFSPLQNCEEAVIFLCKKLNVKVTDSSLKNALIEHPDYPSLLAVSDVLSNYNIANIAIKTSIKEFEKFTVPFIAQINTSSGKDFTVIYSVDSSKITRYNTTLRKVITDNIEEFSKLFTGYVLLVEANEFSGETGYRATLKKEKQQQLIQLLTASAIPVLALIIAITGLFRFGLAAAWPAFFILFTLVGAVAGVLLILYEVDQYNPALQQICHAGKKTNCAAILNSKDAKIFGISWASIGFTYFVGILIALLAAGIVRPDMLFIAIWLNVLALPYIAYSLLYQWRVAKQWCPLCLTVQAALALQFIAGLFGGFYNMSSFRAVPLNTLFTYSILFAIVFLAVQLLIPALEKVKESRSNKQALQRLKHNPQIFEALLQKQKQITEPPEGLGITIGKPDAKHRLIKVCNPYCGPCSKAHPMIEDLLHNNEEAQVQIIFTATENEDDYRAKPARHLLAVDETSKKGITQKALDDWYLSNEKDYDIFAAKYPMNGELQQQTEKLKAMWEWCDKTGISFTPTFFVNGYQLPEIYSVADLKYFLSV